MSHERLGVVEIWKLTIFYMSTFLKLVQYIALYIIQIITSSRSLAWFLSKLKLTFLVKMRDKFYHVWLIVGKDGYEPITPRFVAICKDDTFKRTYNLFNDDHW